MLRVYGLLKRSCCDRYRDRGLVGSLFWRWDVQVYAGSGVADYGVRQFDSTFGARPVPARGQRQTDESTPAVDPQRPCTPCRQQARCSNCMQNWYSSDEVHRIVRIPAAELLATQQIMWCLHGAGIIAGHARKVRWRENARPPRQECRLGCWVRRKSSWLRRGCA